MPRPRLSSAERVRRKRKRDRERQRRLLAAETPEQRAARNAKRRARRANRARAGGRPVQPLLPFTIDGRQLPPCIRRRCRVQLRRGVTPEQLARELECLGHPLTPEQIIEAGDSF